MDKLGAELAIRQLDLMDEAIAQKIKSVNDALNGRLGDLTVSTSLDQAVEAAKNREMISKVVDLFPRAQLSQSDYEFATNDLAHVRWLGYSAVWLKGGAFGKVVPYYVVGEKEAKKDSVALLHSATMKRGSRKPDSPRLFAVHLRKAYQLQREQAFTRRFVEVPKSETDKLYRSSTASLHLNMHSPHAIRIDSRPAFSLPGEWYRMKLGKQVGKRGIQAAIVKDLSEGIHDEDLASFDVFKNLGELAIGFDAFDAFKSILKKRKESLTLPGEVN